MDFYRPWNASLSAGFEPANLGSSGKHDNHYNTENDTLIYIMWVWCGLVRPNPLGGKFKTLVSTAWILESWDRIPLKSCFFSSFCVVLRWADPTFKEPHQLSKMVPKPHIRRGPQLSKNFGVTGKMVSFSHSLRLESCLVLIVSLRS
jgi:hypothetical protein